MIIIQDTREQKPWDFSFYDECEKQVIRTVKTGDYTIEGLEDKICIERKRNSSEIAFNLGQKYKPFERELERMRSFTFKYIICEFPHHLLDIFPKESGMPIYKQKYSKISGNFIKSKINKITDEYGIEFIFCQNSFKAQEKAIEIFTEKYNVLKEQA